VASSTLLALSGLDAGLLVLVGVAAGIFNGVAGGGQLLVFPALLAVGLPALNANITATVGILPSYAGSMAGFRSEMRGQWDRLRPLLPWTTAGAATGAILLLTTPASSFRSLAPWLVAVATVLFAIQPLVVRSMRNLAHDHPTRRVLLVVGTFAISIYGGYFGAAMGVMMLALFGVALLEPLSRINAMRSALSIVIGALSAAIFVIHGHVAWAEAGSLASGTLVGGWIGARASLRLPAGGLRAVVVVVGATTAISLFVR
jgi:uncharacterized membrane protein YfcA